MSEKEVSADIVDLCAILQCIGYKMRSLDTGESVSELPSKDATRVITIHCNLSGMEIILDSTAAGCNCPVERDPDSSGFWQVSATTGGIVEKNKETGSTLFEPIPKSTVDSVKSDLKKIMEMVRQTDKTDINISFQVKRSSTGLNLKDNNVSASMSNINTTPPHLLLAKMKIDTPTRYRSLDALTDVKNVNEEIIPTPGRLLCKIASMSSDSEVIEERKEVGAIGRVYPSGTQEDGTPVRHTESRMPNPCYSVEMLSTSPLEGTENKGVVRQQTYTFSTPARSTKNIRKTCTNRAITKLSDQLLATVQQVKKLAEDLESKISEQSKQQTDANDSVPSLALDVSKISVQKVPIQTKKVSRPLTKVSRSVSQFVSSPNLSGLTNASKVDPEKSNLKRSTSSSTSRLAKLQDRQIPTPGQRSTNLKRSSHGISSQVSPTIFSKRKESGLGNILGSGSSGIPGSYRKLSDRQIGLNPSIERQIANDSPDPSLKKSFTPTGIPTPGSNCVKKKSLYSHVKSTIPKPQSKNT